VNYGQWQKTISTEIANDTLWRMQVYRMALFLADIAWVDVTKLMKDKRTIRLADQLYRAIGSISANIAEGYSRSSGKDQARFYEYALGSARESRDWYYISRFILGENVIAHRLDWLTQIIRLLLTIIPAQRHTKIEEETGQYNINQQFEDIPFTEYEARNTTHEVRNLFLEDIK